MVPRSGFFRKLATQKKNDNFTKGNHRAQETWGHLPSGRAVASAQCPHAPVTLHYRACGRCRDALPGHYLCFSSHDKCNHALLHRAGGVITPAGPGARPGQGRPRPPPSHARAASTLGGGESAVGPPPPHPLYGGHFALASSGGCGLGGFWRSGAGPWLARLRQRESVRGGIGLPA